MFKLAAMTAVASAAAQAPANPTWPKAFTATITHTDTRRKTTDVSTTSFSVSSNAILDSFKDQKGNTVTDLADYGAKRNYMVIGTQCRDIPERGSIQDRIPDLRRVTYNTTSTFNGVSVYVWDDSHAGGPRTMEYLTSADSNEFPVAFTDIGNAWSDAYSNFVNGEPPAGTFNKPAGCK